MPCINLQGHLSLSQFLILDLNFDKDVKLFAALGKIFQILALKEAIVLAQRLTEFTLVLLRVSTFRKLYVTFLSLKTSSITTGFKFFFVLNILVASICGIF